MTVTREKLYEEVWSEPMTTVAARYGVSSNFLARVCERLQVPRPPRGYWAKLEFGKALPKPALPDTRPGDEIEWSRGPMSEQSPRALPKAPEKGTRRTRHSNTPRPEQHELLSGAREHFEAAKELDNGYLRPAKRRLVDIFVSKASVDRALSLANALFIAMEERGHRVVFAPLDQKLRRPQLNQRSEGDENYYSARRWIPDRPTVVFVGTVAIGLTLFELSDEVEVRYVDGKYIPVTEAPKPKRYGSSTYDWTTKRDIPSGRLCLRASSPYSLATWEKQWRESKDTELVTKIPHIIRELESAAPTIVALVEEGDRQAEIRHQEWQAQLEKLQKEEAERRRVQNIKDSREQLFGIIDSWGVAMRIEAFFEDAERRIVSLGDQDREALLNRLKRARSLLEGVDALHRFSQWKAPEER